VGLAVPSITLGFSACAASIARIAAIACSSSSSLNDETPPECSTFISRGIKSAQIFRYAAGCVRRTFATAFSPCLRKSRKIAQMTSSLNALREPRTRPAGLPNAVRLQLHALAYNLGNFLRTLATPEPIKHWSLTTLKDNLIKIGAKVVSHGRYIIFQMAEVAIARQLFQEILRLIAELRPQPPPALA
jgi:hypothetical protein